MIDGKSATEVRRRTGRQENCLMNGRDVLRRRVGVVTAGGRSLLLLLLLGYCNTTMLMTLNKMTNKLFITISIANNIILNELTVLFHAEIPVWSALCLRCHSHY